MALRPALEPALDPALEPMLEPVLEPALEPVLPRVFEPLDRDEQAPPPNCFRQFYRVNKTKIKATAIFAVASAVAVVLALGVKYGLPWLSQRFANGRLDLEKSSLIYRNNIQTNIDPCEDFYRFACGNFLNQSEKNLGTASTMKNMEKLVLSSMESMLSEAITPSESEVRQKLKSFYRLCMDEDKLLKEGNEPMLELLREVGGWPIIEKKKYNRNESWEDVVGRLNNLGFQSYFPFKLLLHAATDKSSRFSMTLEPLSTDRNLEGVDDMYDVTAWLDTTNSVSEQDIVDCYVFEYKLSEMMTLAENPEIHTITTLTDKYPLIQWHKFFDNINADTNVKITGNDTIILKDPHYVDRVSHLLQNTSIEVVRNYVVWRAVKEMVDFVPWKFRNVSDDFCLQALLKKAALAMGSVYLDNFFDHEIKKIAQSIYDNIRSEGYFHINELKWMDGRMKKSILGKLKNLKENFGVPAENLGVGFVREFVESWTVQRNASTLKNYVNLLKAYRRSYHNRVVLPAREYQSILPIELATAAQGVYVRSKNFIHFFAALLQRPFIAVDQPMYLNYGGIGFAIAHEMTHGLNLLSECQNSSCTSYDEFSRKKNCTEDIYSRYLMRQLNETLDGDRNLEENIGDLLGVAVAYRAYEKWFNQSRPAEPALPGLNLTSKQTFWLNIATSFCTYRTDSELSDFMNTDPHSPEEARINVAFANMREFSRDFECPDNSTMNPADKCDL